MNYFITGTDTAVGKTLISCALLHGFAAQGKRVVGMKPVAAGGSLRSNGAPTGGVNSASSLLDSRLPNFVVPLVGAAGCDDGDLHEDVRQLRAAGNVQAGLGQVNPYCFAQAVAPHLAAQLAGIRIDFARIAESFSELAAQADVVIVEGVGGLLVPLNAGQDGADLAAELGLPVILVVGMRLGCLNHALLTVEAITARGLTLAGWVANVVDADMALLDENVAALRQRINAPLLGVVPYLPQADAGMAAMRLDLSLLGQV